MWQDSPTASSRGFHLHGYLGFLFTNFHAAHTQKFAYLKFGGDRFISIITYFLIETPNRRYFRQVSEKLG